MNKTWEEIRAEFELGIGFRLNHLTKFKWEQFYARRELVWTGTKDEIHELEQVIICENSAYNNMYKEFIGCMRSEYYNESAIINSYLLGCIDVLKRRV